MTLNELDKQKIGKHDFDRESALNYNAYDGQDKFSINIYSWGLYSNGTKLKKLAGKVRIHGSPQDKLKMIEMADNIVKMLDEGEWDGRKNVYL